MTTVNVSKRHLIGTGYAEMPQNGRRYRFLVERYRDDDGSEWGRIASMEEIPDVGPYLWIPSWGVDSQAETDYLVEEYEYEKTHPDPLTSEWWAEHRANQRRMMARYDEARDERAAIIKRNPVTFGRD